MEITVLGALLFSFIGGFVAGSYVDKRPSPSSCWIYPGERRPVVVQAQTKEEAERLVRTSPHYDGFPVYLYTVEEFARKCKEGTAT